mmetsp:Transcript_19209/g.42477  ORF Transcript_19209/g.42477 Transcript_19209/m.42477 type:complete len:271 (+) Transcript_19209:27-839(+)
MLKGKSAIVTGASSGIGRATALLMVKEGANVLAVGRNEEALKQLETDAQAAIGEGGSKLIIGVGDLAMEGTCERLVKQAKDAFGELTTLVNCAGVLKGAPVGSEGFNLANYDFNFNNNTRQVFDMMSHAVPLLQEAGKAKKGASILTVSSVNAQQSFAGVAAYCASKAAVDMLTQCAAVDLAKDGVRVNAVNPGVVVTELQKRSGLGDEAYAAFLERSISTTHPLAAARGSVAGPEEVADLIVFLVSDKAGFITGECVKIDGGRSCLGAR